MFNLIFFSVRATSEDEAMVTSWAEVTVSGLDSRKSVRADFTLGFDNNSDSEYFKGQMMRTMKSLLSQSEIRWTPGHQVL